MTPPAHENHVSASRDLGASLRSCAMTTVRPVSLDTETSRHAITAIIWAVVGLVAPIPFLFPLMALFSVTAAQNDIQQNPDRMKGWELTHAARAVAWVALTVWLAVVVVGMVTLVAYALSGG